MIGENRCMFGSLVSDNIPSVAALVVIVVAVVVVVVVVVKICPCQDS